MKQRKKNKAIKAKAATRVKIKTKSKKLSGGEIDEAKAKIKNKIATAPVKNESDKIVNDIVQLILQDHKPLKKLIEVMKDVDYEFSERKQAFEEFAPLLLTHAKAAQDDELMGAKIKVLAEMVEHHIKEEETEMLPDFKKHTEAATRAEIGEKYLELKEQLNSAEGDEAEESEESEEHESNVATETHHIR